MIFVTVGTHEQPFNRLIQKVDELKCDGVIEKDQIFQPVKKDTDNLQAMMNTVGEAGDVMHLSQNVVEAFIDRIEVFNDERVKIHFTFEDVLADHAE